MGVTEVSGVDRGQIKETLRNSDSVLLLSSDRQYDSDVCGTLLSVAAPEDAQYLAVTLDDTPDERLDEWRAHVGQLPAETGIIAVGEMTRSAAIAATPATPQSSPVEVDTVANPSDLTGLAIAIGAYLDAWSDTDRTPVFCFHSITSLLYHADELRVFRFLHSMTGRLRELGAVAHYHLDPIAHDEATVNRFSAIFDAVIEVHEDGTASVRERR